MSKESGPDTVETLLRTKEVFPPPKSIVEEAWVKDYDSLYKESISNIEKFWEGVANQLSWYKKWDRVLEWNYPWAKWFPGAQCNIIQNALDRHQNTPTKNKTAILWEGEKGENRAISYGELNTLVCKFANVLKSLGIKKGDRVSVYLPRIPEQFVTMLACAKIGAIHCVVYSGFSAGALQERIKDSEAKVLVTADGSHYHGKVLALANIVGELKDVPTLKNVIYVRRVNTPIAKSPAPALYWDELMAKASDKCDTERMASDDPLYFLYTSGTTGRPKGVVHVHGGYMVGLYITMKWIFDLKDNDIFWCTADPGWVTGHSYIVYGPLMNGATIVFYEGAPDQPDPGRWWKIVQDKRITVLYSTPTGVRALMRFGEDIPKKYDLSSLRLLGTVGEPINPEAWHWYHKNIGRGKCPIMDTWWQTETGMILITPLPCLPLKAGSAAKPFPGIIAEIVDKEGNILPPNKGGNLAIKTPWPAMMKTIHKDPARYEAYWNSIKGWYQAGDIASKDDDGYFWVKGRSDDVIKTSGYRIGTAEVESALVSFPAVAEAAVIGKPDPLKGEIIKAFVILRVGYQRSPTIIDGMKKHVRTVMGPIAVPAEIDIVDSLPKTRSGKIMRRLLRAKELGLPVGDISSLEE
jgi:acetyl-CoA synthetase